ncbi:polysaccharide deacetylase family protein [Pseudovibrio sp. SPO723]|uniref:polysaccharide deacetylase family protein n=1 Tax=Nesiotobacter zosterae TaxID=392721 RepID=UPI0029C5E75F|nr:polysaccharide deacetylase family protein [Pseudovibrio sp. SPO723]MDX5592611.1 polysaccharide deacetylase family protein [Pseudovibrio sp. SPO723]
MNRRDKLIALAGRLLSMSGLGKVLARPTKGMGVIFTLHRVLPESDRPFQPNGMLEVTPEFLEAMILQVREEGLEFVSLTEAMERLQLGARYTGPRFVALTFDDGYRDNLEIAYPVLKHHGVPFTVFITSGFCDRSSEIWWVALERLIADRDVFELHDDVVLSSYPCCTVEEKQAAFTEARHFLMNEVDENAQRRILRATAGYYDFDLKALCEELVLSWEELREWGNDPLVSFGAHTATHAALERLDETQLKQEVLGGVDRMVAELGMAPKHFAYPYGFAGAADQKAFSVLRSLGYDCCVTTRPGMIKASHYSGREQLPRVSLNGYHQSREMVSLFLTGLPFALYNLVSKLRGKIA